MTACAITLFSSPSLSSRTFTSRLSFSYNTQNLRFRHIYVVYHDSPVYPLANHHDRFAAAIQGLVHTPVSSRLASSRHLNTTYTTTLLHHPVLGEHIVHPYFGR